MNIYPNMTNKIKETGNEKRKIRRKKKKASEYFTFLYHRRSFFLSKDISSNLLNSLKKFLLSLKGLKEMVVSFSCAHKFVNPKGLGYLLLFMPMAIGFTCMLHLWAFTFTGALSLMKFSCYLIYLMKILSQLSQVELFSYQSCIDFYFLYFDSSMNELVEKFNTAYDRHSRRGGRAAFM